MTEGIESQPGYYKRFFAWTLHKLSHGTNSRLGESKSKVFEALEKSNVKRVAEIGE